MNISTITKDQILPEATKAIERYTKRSDTHSILTRYDTHLSTEDLVMETVEKVIRANPEYLTKTYVWLSAKSVCINRCLRKRIETVEPSNPFEALGEEAPSLENEVIGDIADTSDSLLEALLESMGTEETLLFNHLIEGTPYVDIARAFNVSLRTIERQIADLKWKISFLLNEEEPE